MTSHWFMGGLTLWVVACRGPTVDQIYEEFDNAPGIAQPPAGASQAPSTPDPRYPESAVARARVACADPPGTASTYDSVETFARLLGRSWAYCPGKMFVDADFEGVEFTPDGHFYYLSRDPGGYLTRSTGALSGGSYGIFPFDGDLRGRLQITFANGGVLYSRTAFESGPTRMRLDQESLTFDYFVPLGD
jgi:hypothetical protein